MSCLQTFTDYSLRSLGFGKRLLPTTDITLCDQFVLIGSGMIWNIYFAVLALGFGFFFATALALGKANSNPWLSKASRAFIFFFRGTPLFIQLFFAYELFVLLPKIGVEFTVFGIEMTAETRWLTRAWLGSLIVLFLNTSAYAAEIFYGAYQSVPMGEVEAANAYGMSPKQRFRKIVWPTMLRLAWPAYTNEAIFLFHSTSLAFVASFPTWRQKGDALYYAKYMADKTYNPFISYPIAAMYFILATLIIIMIFGAIGKRLNQHIAPTQRLRFRYRPISIFR